MTDRIKPDHLERTAFVYIRQSTLQQVRHNTESGRRQYALEGRAKALGFKKVVVIDDDLGVSGTGNAERPGFAKLLAAVCNGEAGAVFALEASRLARNNRDWHHLIDLCVLTDTIVVDADGAYDPSRLNDRMLLGLKGTMSEFEIGILRQRAQEAYQQKVQRGEVLTMVPIGYDRRENNGIEKTCDRQIQEAVQNLFQRFEEMGTLRQALLWYHQEKVTFPRRQRREGITTIQWCLPDYQQLHRMLKNPTYAGAFAHGRRRTETNVVKGRPRKSYGHTVPQDEWSVLILNHHEGYIDWERYMKNQQQLKANSTKSHGGNATAPRSGNAMLSGLLRCSKCGLKLSVAYRGGPGRSGRYHCARGIKEMGKPSCQSFAAFRVDQAIEEEVIKACESMAVQASMQALKEEKSELRQIQKLLRTALEKAQYEVDRARRQYDAVDPANRLVAAELEARWNHALNNAAEAELRYTKASTEKVPLNEKQREKILSLGSNLQELWHDSKAPLELKKRIIRIAIREIVVQVNNVSAKVELLVHWSGGVHTRLEVRKNRVGQNKNAADEQTIEIVRELACCWSDRYIAQMLNRIGSRTGAGNGWSENRVRSFRGQHGIPVFKAEPDRPWLTMQEAAKRLGVSVAVVRTMVNHGRLPARQIATGLPWMIKPEDLTRTKVVERVDDVKLGRRTPRENVHQTIMPSI
ncbi:recombinase family protein [bacterium]|nr:recombinase family protein [bacterium]